MDSSVRAVGGAGTDDKIRLVAKMLLAANDMTTLDLGRHLGLGRTPIYDRMQGRKPFTVAEVARMADQFGVPVSVFFAGPEGLIAQLTRSGGEGTIGSWFPAGAEFAADIGRAA